MTAPAPRPFPLEPLLQLTRCSRARLARRVQASGDSIAQAAVEGLTAWQADRWAGRCDLLPTEVWGHLWWEHAPPADDHDDLDDVDLDVDDSGRVAA